MERKPKQDIASKTIKPLTFNPKEMDISQLRKLPELNIAAITGIPKRELERGRWKP